MTAPEPRKRPATTGTPARCAAPLPSPCSRSRSGRAKTRKTSWTPSGSSCASAARLAPAARHDRNAGRNAAETAVPESHRHRSRLQHRTASRDAMRTRPGTRIPSRSTGRRHVSDTSYRNVRRSDRHPAIDPNGRNPLSPRDNQAKARLRSILRFVSACKPTLSVTSASILPSKTNEFGRGKLASRCTFRLFCVVGDSRAVVGDAPAALLIPTGECDVPMQVSLGAKGSCQSDGNDANRGQECQYPADFPVPEMIFRQILLGRAVALA